MPIDVGFPYTHALIGPTLTSIPTSLSSPSVAGNAGAEVITAGGSARNTAGELTDIKASIKSYTTERTYDEIDQTSIADTAKRYARGRVDFEATLTLYSDDTTAALVAGLGTGEDRRLLYLERSTGTGRKTVAVVQATGITETIGDDGSVEYSITLKNAGPAPVSA